MANALAERYLPASWTQEKFAGMKQKKFYNDLASEKASYNKLQAEEDPNNWDSTSKMAYKKHVQESGGQPLPPAAWKKQNASYFIPQR